MQCLYQIYKYDDPAHNMKPEKFYLKFIDDEDNEQFWDLFDRLKDEKYIKTDDELVLHLLIYSENYMMQDVLTQLQI